MNQTMKCPCCGATIMVLENGTYECFKCPFTCAAKDFKRIAIAMKFALATVALETAMEPLNSGRLKMGEALPAIKLAMADQNACEECILEVFRK